MGCCFSKSSHIATNELTVSAEQQNASPQYNDEPCLRQVHTENQSLEENVENEVQNIIHIHSESRRADSDDESDDDHFTEPELKDDAKNNKTDEYTIEATRAMARTRENYDTVQKTDSGNLTPEVQSEHKATLSQTDAMADLSVEAMSGVDTANISERKLESTVEEEEDVVLVDKEEVESEILPPAPLPLSPTTERKSHMTEETTRQRSDSEDSTQSTSSVFRAMARRISISGYENDFASTSRTRQEVAVVNGKETVLRRTFGKYDNGFQGVGWVEDADVSQCMICHADFDRIFLSKHHCRACGNIICHKCSPKKALVCGIEEYGVQRVCTQCHWGQELVHPANALDTIEEEEPL